MLQLQEYERVTDQVAHKIKNLAIGRRKLQWEIVMAAISVSNWSKEFAKVLRKEDY